MTGVPDIAVGAIVAACIAGFLSFLTLVASKEQKTSEFRQSWIDAVRDDIATFISKFHAIHDEYRVRNVDPAEAWAAAREDFLEANASLARLRLRLNPNEAESLEVLEIATSIESRLNDMPDQNDDEAMTALDDFLAERTKMLTDTAARLLKAEWKRVKRGEPIFLISKWVALLGGIGLAITLSLRWFGVV